MLSKITNTLSNRLEGLVVGTHNLVVRLKVKCTQRKLADGNVVGVRASRHNKSTHEPVNHETSIHREMGHLPNLINPFFCICRQEIEQLEES